MNSFVILVSTRPKAWLCGRSPAEIVCSNSAGGVGICMLSVASLRPADHSSRVLLSVVRRCV